MSDLLTLQNLLLVVEAVAASLLLPPLAWLLSKAWRRSAAGRRLVWITAFAMLLGLPALALVAPSLAVIALPAPPPADLAAVPDIAPVAAPIAAQVAAQAAAAPADAAPSGYVFSLFDLIPVAFAVWLAGIAKLGVQHLIALVRLELMRRSAVPWRMPTPVPVRGCRLMVSDDCPGPMTWGAFRPVIMLPEEALDWPSDRLTTVLRHELAHVRRRDGLAQAVALIACALYWPNPLVWAAARALRREAELAADDEVIAAGALPSAYAGQLLELAAEWRERRLTPTGLAMAAPPALSQRVQSILSTDAIRTGATSMDAFKLVLLGGAATAALTLARPSVAEVPAPPAPVQQAELAPAAPATPAPSAASRPAERSAVAPAAKAVRPAPVSSDQHTARYHDGVYQFTLRHDDRVGDDVVKGSQVVEFALQDVPAPPAPPAVGVAPVPPAPGAAPLPPAAPFPLQPGQRRNFTLQLGPGWQANRLTPEQRAELDRKMAAIGPAIDKAIKDAHIEDTVRKALSAQDEKTREQVARQLEEIGPRIQREIANAQLGLRFAQIQPQIEAQMREQRRQAEERQAQAEDRVASQLEEQAKRARERAQRARDQLKELQQAPQPAPAPRN